MPKKILIADDELPIRMLLEQTLEDFELEGVELEVVDNGADALRFITEEQPELVFLDVMMPKMNGFDVCKAVKADPALAAVHIVILTAKGQEIDRHRGQEVGADLYMTKPFDPKAIVSHAAKVLEIDA